MPEVTSYPRSRLNRIGGQAAAGAQTYLYPRTRVFNFNMAVNGINTRQTISGARCQGPALIKNIRLKWSGSQDPPKLSCELGYARTSVFENPVATTVTRPYTLLTELSDQQAFLTYSVGQGIINTPYTNDTSGAWDLNLIIDEPDFFPTVSLWTAAAGLFAIVGFITVVENVSPAALASFL